MIIKKNFFFNLSVRLTPSVGLNSRPWGQESHAVPTEPTGHPTSNDNFIYFLVKVSFNIYSIAIWISRTMTAEYSVVTWLFNLGIVVTLFLIGLTFYWSIILH